MNLEKMRQLMTRAATLGLEAYRHHHTIRALSVGCVITAEDGTILSEAFSRELLPNEYEKSWHAEAAAIYKYQYIAGKTFPLDTIMFSTVEPCGIRASGGVPCVQRILETGIKHIVFGLEEPPQLVEQTGIERLTAAQIKLSQVLTPEIASKIAEANPHIKWPTLT